MTRVELVVALSLGLLLIALFPSCSARIVQETAQHETQEALQGAEREDERLDELEAEHEALVRQVEDLDRQLQAVREKVRQTEQARVAVRDELLKLKIEQEQHRPRRGQRAEHGQVTRRLRELLTQLQTLLDRP